MGNNHIMGGTKKRAKVMKINGESFKLKTPTMAMDVVKNHPGHVLLESQTVKRFGVRAKPLEPEEPLQPNKVYFLVELPRFSQPRRTRSALEVTAKDRLESLKLRRSASELSVCGKPGSSSSGPLQVKMKLPRSQVAKLMEESVDDADAADKIISLCLQEAATER